MNINEVYKAVVEFDPKWANRFVKLDADKIYINVYEGAFPQIGVVSIIDNEIEYRFDDSGEEEIWRFDDIENFIEDSFNQ